ncbi:MAG: discoidin domain-containing protein [Verrucomicrobia bacterium]|nr:discoidin domain-containing protein [Verrucomicrobiota bacterium]
MKTIKCLFLLIASGLTTLAANPTLPLAGEWRFQLDREDAGVRERWFERALPDRIKLPGTLTAQGIGDPVTVDTKWIGGIVDKSWFIAPEYAKYREPDNVKIPFWLQPELYYAGAAWFQRDIEIPEDWKEKRVVLFLERAHWETRVWINDKLIGTNNSLATPHEYELGIVARASGPFDAAKNQNRTGETPVPLQLAPGKHTLTIRVDNRMVIDVGENSHSVSDHTQGNWNGIVGKIELRATPLVWIEEMRVYPDLPNASVRIVGRIGNATGKPGSGKIRLGQVTNAIDWDSHGCTFETAATWGGAAMKEWSEFQPALFDGTLGLFGDGIRDERTVLFGFREFSTGGTQFTLNGQKTLFRGTLECAIFPKTGHPPMEVEEWKRIIRVAKSYGLNMIRFHSWCPPEAAFVAADELGFYFQIEASTWPNQSTTLGDGKPVDQWLYEETDRILKYYGNHPSFILMAHGNEPGGPKHKEFLARYVNHYKALDPRRLWTSGSGWPELPENQFHVTPDPRIQAWGDGLKSRINAKPPETMTDYRDYIAARSVPVISHEIGQWCVYPNFDEIPKYTGYLKPRNFEIFRERLEANGMGKLAKQFLLASGKLQTLCYKEDIESALRTPGMGGFQLLDLHDFPGQGTALVGVLDPFWEEKGYVTAAEFSRFCNSTVPLVRLPKRVFTTDEVLKANIEVAHFGPLPLIEHSWTPGFERYKRPMVSWKLVHDDGSTVASEPILLKTIPIGNANPVGRVIAGCGGLSSPGRYKLVVSVDGHMWSKEFPSRTVRVENDWDIWVYPSQVSEEPADVLVTAQFDEAAQVRLRSGGKVLLTIPGRQVRNFDTAPVKFGFSSIFWNTAWTGRQAPTTLGILCDPKHPALAQFPTDFHSNWQWWYLVHRAGALRLDLLPKGVEPVVRVIDDWVTARPLGLVVEGNVGPGKIIVCGFDLTRDADDPVSRQMRASLLRYMGTMDFKPGTAFTPEQIRSLITPSMASALHGVRSITASSEQGEYDAASAVDGDPTTIWHTAWGDGAPGFPHELVVELTAPQAIAGITALPRQDGNRNGWIRAYEIYASADGQTWDAPVARGEFPGNASLKTVKFEKPVAVKFIKLRAVSGHANSPWASLAELGLLPMP